MRGKLYHTRGKDTPAKPVLAGTVSITPIVQIADPKAATIKHKGAEQGGERLVYAGTTQGFAPAQPARKIKHRGKDQR